MKNYRFSRIWFFINNVFDMLDRKMKMLYRVRLVEPVRNIYVLTLKGRFQNLTSGQISSRSSHYSGRLVCKCISSKAA